MNGEDMIDTCAAEVAERASRVFTMVLVATEEEGCPLTARQKALIGSALIEAFCDLKESLQTLARGSDLLARLAPYTTHGTDERRTPDVYDPVSGGWVRISEEIDRFLETFDA